MKKRYSLNIIRAKRSYSVKEAANALNVHVRTVQSWMKDGLRALEGSCPYLIMGYELKSYLAAESQKQKHPLGPGEFFCLRCRGVVTGSHAQTISTGRAMGRDKEAVILKGICAICSGKVNRFAVVERPSGGNVLRDAQVNIIGIQ